MRILHLAYEDPRQPGSGGGAVRTREINRRLAQRHEVTAVVSSYRGARQRHEDGVTWVPAGGGHGRAARLAYLAAVGREVRRRPHDLVVEDFGAPFSVAGSPAFTRRPVIASVQWLFAREMRDKYGLPFDRVEARGLRLYPRFIAVSDWLAGELRRRAPHAEVETIPEGVDAAAFAARAQPGDHLLFLGRLDLRQKGLDLLLEAYARARAGAQPVAPLVIAGTGPDEAPLRQLAQRLAIAEWVDFRGHVAGAEKHGLLASARAVLMPSRHETFGIVAAEALAAGARLVAFDAGPLREVTGGHATLLPPEDVAGLTAAITAASTERDPAFVRAQRRRFARRYDWDDIAARQESLYLRAIAAEAGP